jgi:hypothetical protein
MRYLVVAVVIAGCHSKPTDIEIFCSPEAALHANKLDEFGPWYEPLVSSDQMKDTLRRIKDGRYTIYDFGAVIAKAKADAHITSCPTADILFREQ